MPENTLYRLQEVERRIGVLEHETRDVNVLRQEIVNLWREIHDLSEEVKTLRRSLLTAGLSFLVGMALFSVTLFEVFK